MVEGNVTTGYVASAEDGDGDTLTYDIVGGDDQALFSIDADSGVLSFISAPDFSSPADSDGDNDYLVEISVDDGNGGLATLLVTIGVTEAVTTGDFTIEISYPTSNANLGGGVTETTVSGRLLNNTGEAIDFSTVNFIDVNGQLAVAIPGDSTRWTVQIPVTSFENTINVSAELNGGETGNISQDIDNQALMYSPIASTLDTTINRLLLIDSRLNALLAVDPVTGNRTLISNNTYGSGVDFISLRSVAYDAINNRALIVDRTPARLLAVDLSNGDRSILSDDSNGGGTQDFGRPEAVVMNEDAGQALVVDSSLRGIIAVELDNGDRTALSSPSIGTGTNLSSSARAFTFDASNNTAYVLDYLAIRSVDLSTGNRDLFYDANSGGDPNFSSLATSLALNVDNNRLLVADSFQRMLLGIDLSTQLPAILSDDDNGSGISFAPYTVTMDPDNSRALTLDAGIDALVAIDLTSGDRTLLSDSRIGNGPQLSPGPLAFDSTENRLLIGSRLSNLEEMDPTSGDRSEISTDLGFPEDMVIDAVNNSLLVANRIELASINLQNGVRTPISNNTGLGAGDTFGHIANVVLDKTGNRALAADINITALLEVNLDTGDRNVFSGNGVGDGPEFGGIYDMVLDSTNNRILIMGRAVGIALIAVSLDDGERSIVSGDGVGSGVEFPNIAIEYAPVGLALDAPNNRALTIDPNLDAIVAVDLSNGERSIVSNAPLNGGRGLNFTKPDMTPESLTVDTANNRAFVSDWNFNHIVVIDLDSGERAVASK